VCLQPFFHRLGLVHAQVFHIKNTLRCTALAGRGVLHWGRNCVDAGSHCADLYRRRSQSRSLRASPAPVRRIVVFQPRLHRRRTLLVNTFLRLVRRHAPALQILASRANRQFNAGLPGNQFLYGLAHPQRICHLQRIGRLVDDQAANHFLLFLHQESAVIFFATGLPRLYCRYLASDPPCPREPLLGNPYPLSSFRVLEVGAPIGVFLQSPQQLIFLHQFFIHTMILSDVYRCRVNNQGKVYYSMLKALLTRALATCKQFNLSATHQF